MKIAIKGDEKNGRKIIEYFESIGKKQWKWYGNDESLYYHINSYNEVDARDYPPKGYTVYESWNEFENKYLNKNKMEKRNIEISLEKAKEWYKQGGDLRQVALQAFSESELIQLDKFPSSWDEYNRVSIFKGNRVDAGDIFGSAEYCHFATKEEADAFVALGKLIQLRDEYWRLDNNWNSDLVKCDEINPTILYVKNLGRVMRVNTTGHYLLMFRTDELRNKFYENFKDLLEQAKMFL